MIRIYAAVHGMKFYSFISDMHKLKVSYSWFTINLKVLSQTEMCKTHSDHGLNWLARNTYLFKSSSITCSVDMRWQSPILRSFYTPVWKNGRIMLYPPASVRPSVCKLFRFRVTPPTVYVRLSWNLVYMKAMRWFNAYYLEVMVQRFLAELQPFN